MNTNMNIDLTKRTTLYNINEIINEECGECCNALNACECLNGNQHFTYFIKTFRISGLSEECQSMLPSGITDESQDTRRAWGLLDVHPYKTFDYNLEGPLTKVVRGRRSYCVPGLHTVGDYRKWALSNPYVLARIFMLDQYKISVRTQEWLGGRLTSKTSQPLIRSLPGQPQEKRRRVWETKIDHDRQNWNSCKGMAHGTMYIAPPCMKNEFAMHDIALAPLEYTKKARRNHGMGTMEFGTEVDYLDDFDCFDKALWEVYRNKLGQPLDLITRSKMDNRTDRDTWYRLYVLSRREKKLEVAHGMDPFFGRHLRSCDDAHRYYSKEGLIHLQKTTHFGDFVDFFTNFLSYRARARRLVGLKGVLRPEDIYLDRIFNIWLNECTNYHIRATVFDFFRNTGAAAQNLANVDVGAINNAANQLGIAAAQAQVTTNSVNAALSGNDPGLLRRVLGLRPALPDPSFGPIKYVVTMVKDFIADLMGRNIPVEMKKMLSKLMTPVGIFDFLKLYVLCMHTDSTLLKGVLIVCFMHDYGLTGIVIALLEEAYKAFDKWWYPETVPTSAIGSLTKILAIMSSGIGGILVTLFTMVGSRVTQTGCMLSMLRKVFQGVGNFGRDIWNTSKGLETMPHLYLTIVDYLKRFWGWCTGNGVTTTSHEDLKNWYLDVMRACDPLEREIILQNEEKATAATKLYSRGVELFALYQETLSPQELIPLRQTLQEARKIGEAASKMLEEKQVTITPYHMVFSAPPGVGKTNLLHALTHIVRTKFHPEVEASSFSYLMPSHTDHADNYHSQKMLWMDDVDMTKDIDMALFLMMVVSNVGPVFKKADLVDKGKVSKIEYVFSTTNTPYAVCDQIATPEAYLRRRRYVTKVCVSPDFMEGNELSKDKILRYYSTNAGRDILDHRTPLYQLYQHAYRLEQEKEEPLDENIFKSEYIREAAQMDYNQGSYFTFQIFDRMEEKPVTRATYTMKTYVSWLLDDMTKYKESQHALRHYNEALADELTETESWAGLLPIEQRTLHLNRLRARMLAGLDIVDDDVPVFTANFLPIGRLEGGKWKVPLEGAENYNYTALINDDTSYDEEPQMGWSNMSTVIEGRLATDFLLLLRTNAREPAQLLSMYRDYPEAVDVGNLKYFLEFEDSRASIYPLNTTWMIESAQTWSHMPPVRKVAVWTRSCNLLRIHTQLRQYRMGQVINRNEEADSLFSGMRSIFRAALRLLGKVILMGVCVALYYSLIIAFLVGINALLSPQPTQNTYGPGAGKAKGPLTWTAATTNVDDVRHRLRYNHQIMKRTEGYSTSSVNIFYVAEEVALVPAHFLINVRYPLEVITSGVEVEQHHYIEESDVYRFPDIDAVLVSLKSGPRMYKNAVKHFIKEKHLEYLTGSDITIIARDMRDETLRNNTTTSIIEVTDIKMRGVDSAMRSAVYTGSVPVGSSGGPVFITNPHIPMSLGGIQSGTSRNWGFFAPITQEALEIGLNTLGTYQKEEFILPEVDEGVKVFTTSMKEVFTNTIVVATQPIDKTPYLANKTPYIPTPISHLYPVNSWEPAILSDFDYRRSRHIGKPHFLHKSANKFCSDSVAPLKKDDMEACIDGMVSSRLSSGEFRGIRVVTEEEAVLGLPRDGWTGMDLTTSPGLPWVLEKNREAGKTTDIRRVGDGVYISGRIRSRICDLREKTSMGIKPHFLQMDSMKDELRNTATGKENNVRLVTVLPQEVVVYARMLTGDYNAALHRAARRGAAVSVGINPDSVHAKIILSKLCSRSGGENCFDIDVTNWDGHFSFDYFHLVNEVRNRIYNDDYTIARHTLSQSMQFGLIQLTRHVYSKMRGMSSGWVGTAEENSEAHEALVYIVWRNLCRKNNKTALIHYSTYVENVVIFVYGDDVIYSVTDLVKEWFNGRTVAQEYQTLGWPATPASKRDVMMECISWRELSFLKRAFKIEEETKIVTMPINLSVVHGLLTWQRGGGDAQFRENLHTVFRFLVPHGRAIFYQYKRRLNENLVSEGLAPITLMFEDMHAEMVEKYYDV